MVKYHANGIDVIMTDEKGKTTIALVLKNNSEAKRMAFRLNSLAFKSLREKGAQ